MGQPTYPSDRKKNNSSFNWYTIPNSDFMIITLYDGINHKLILIECFTL